MGELTTATILFCDLVGSTALASEVGDDEADEVRRDLFGAWRSAIAKTSGEEVKTGGDGMMVAFTSVVEALDCAVGMQRATEYVAGDLKLKVGLSTGETTREDEDYFGTPVIEASRLCDAADAGQILAVDLVQRLAGSRSDHTFSQVGELELKGLDPLPTVQVAWEASGDDAVAFPPMLEQARRLAFVGRRVVREQLEQAYAEVSQGGRRVVLLAGEPGVGKTRLAAEFASWGHDHGAVVLAGRCDEGMGAPLQPWAQMLEHVATAVPRERVERIAGAELPVLARLASGFGESAPGEGGEHERYRLFEAMDELLSGLGTRDPTVLVVDDLHWADESSLKALRHLAGSTRNGSLLVIATYRDTDVDRRHPLSDVLADLRRQGTVERHLLRGLSQDEVAELIAARAGHDAPPEFVAAVAAQTEGNPFFTDEVLQHLARTGAIVQEHGRWTTAGSVADLGLPEGIRDVVGRRLSQLSEATNEVLRVAAVVGAEFDLDVVSEAAETNRAAALTALEEASAAVILTEVPERVGRFSFTHALVRQTLLEELSTTRTVHLHWAVGEALETRGADIDAVAYHLGEGVLAGDAERAARTSIDAGARAASRNAGAEAVAQYDRAVRILDQAGSSESLLLDALIGLTAAHMFRMARAEAEGTLTRAADLARSRGDQEGFLRLAGTIRGGAAAPFGTDQSAAALGSTFAAVLQEALDLTEGAVSNHRALLLANRGTTRGYVEDPKLGGEMLAEAVEIAEQLGDPGTELAVQWNRTPWVNAQPSLEVRGAWLEKVRLLMSQARPEQLVRTGLFSHHEGSLALARGDRSRAEACWRDRDRTEIKAGSVAVRNDSVSIALADGDIDRANRELSEAREQAKLRTRDGSIEMFDRVILAEHRGRIMALTGEAATVADNTRTLVESGLIPEAFWAQLAWLEAMAGRLGEAAEAASHVTDSYRDHTFEPQRIIRFMAETAALAAEAPLATSALGIAEPWAGQILFTFAGSHVEGAADAAIGKCLLALGRNEEAVTSLRAGVEIEERCDFHGLATGNRYFLAQALGGAGDRDAARAERDRCLADAGRMGLVPYEQLASRLSV